MRPSPSPRLPRGALALSAALGLSATALSAPAAAATGADRCPDGRLCVLSEPGYRGEMLASDADGTLRTYRGTGRGGSSTRTKVGGGWKATNELVGAGDMESDGRADLVARDTAGRLRLCPGNGRGAFRPGKPIGTGDGNLRAPVRFAELRPSTYAF